MYNSAFVMLIHLQDESGACSTCVRGSGCPSIYWPEHAAPRIIYYLRAGKTAPSVAYAHPCVASGVPQTLRLRRLRPSIATLITF